MGWIWDLSPTSLLGTLQINPYFAANTCCQRVWLSAPGTQDLLLSYKVIRVLVLFWLGEGLRRQPGINKRYMKRHRMLSCPLALVARNCSSNPSKRYLHLPMRHSPGCTMGLLFGEGPLKGVSFFFCIWEWHHYPPSETVKKTLDIHSHPTSFLPSCMQLDPTSSTPQSLDQCPAGYIRIVCGNVKQHRFQIPGSPSQEVLNSFSSEGGACNLHSSPAPRPPSAFFKW